MVRTRIAPSPTGFPHIGTVYQALFDFAYAHKHGGQFVVRIEDTDRARQVEGSEEQIFAMLDWFGLVEDESPRKGGEYGPYRQSERLKIYKKYAEELVQKGHAYYCFCSKERLDELRAEQTKNKVPPMYDRHCLDSADAEERIRNGEPHVMRLKIPHEKTIVFKDEIRGEIHFEGKDIDDQVLMKADGFPTYHLAVVVDDYLMKITHIVRGEEWISSTPKHVLLYEAFGWDMPQFFHTALLRNQDKLKLGKRHGHASATWYEKEGFLPEAILNFLALMGWSHKEGKEIFSLEEFINVVELKNLKAMGPVFDMQKLLWMNGEYIRAMDANMLAERLFTYYEKFYNGCYSLALIKKTVLLVQERIKTLREYDDYCRFFLEAPKEYEKDISGDRELRKKIHEVLAATPDDRWNLHTIETVLQSLAEKENIGFRKFFMAVRLAVTGKKATPPINESLVILGKNETLKRLSA